MSEHKNVFLHPAASYTREINHLAQYVKQTSFYVSKMTGKPISEVTEKVRATVKSSMHNPRVIYYSRAENLDKNKFTTTLLGYINDTIAKKEILAPTFTTYKNQGEFMSPFSEFMIDNKKARSAYKKKSHQAKMQGDEIMHVFYDKEQNNAKTYNNAGSGCFGSKGSILFNPTCHSTLTSTVRTETSISNASNERLLEGNRHYRDADIILYNLISITSDFDRDLMLSVVDKYSLVYPSVDDVIECIERSYRLYAYDSGSMRDIIIPFVNTLDGPERAAFMFTGDLYHLNKINQPAIFKLLDALSVSVKSDSKVDKPESFLHKFDEAIVNHVLQIFCDYIVGVSRTEFVNKFDDSVLQDMYATASYVTSVLRDYSDLIRLFFLTKHLPPSSAYIYNQIRRSVVGSDTDATMFSVDTLTTQRFGKIVFNTQTKAFASSLCLFATQVMSHQLAIFSANLGISTAKIFDIAMKPEFTFPVFAQTPVAKHYYTFATVQEGMHFSDNKYKYEEKGVHLKNSAHPDVIRNGARDMMRKILNDLYENKPLNVREKILEVIELEQEIKRSLLAGENTYYKNVDIKIASSYREVPEKSPYRFHLLWEEVFKPKYGAIDDPDYRAIKIPLDLVNSLRIKEWLASMEDRDMAQRMANWLQRGNRKDFSMVYLNTSLVQSSGIPKEIADVLDYRRIILDLTVSRRMVLSSLGIYPKHDMTVTEMYMGNV